MCPVLCYASILCTPPLYKGVGPGNIQLSPARLLYETWPSRHGLHLAALGLQHRPWGLPNPTSRKPTFHSATLVQLHSTTPNTCGTQLSLQTKSKLNSIQTQLNATQLNSVQLKPTQFNMAPTLEEHLALHHLIASLPLNFQVASPSLQVASLLPFQQVASTPGPKMASPQGPQVASHPGLPRASPTPGLQVAYYLSPEVAPPDLQVAPPAPDGVSVPPGSCGKQRSRRRRRRSTSEYGPLGGPRKRAEYGLPCQEAHLRPHNMGSHPLPCPLGGPRQSAECYVSEPCAPPCS